jgi:hypothetical protein
MKPVNSLMLIVLFLANSAFAGKANIRAEMEKKFPYSKIISISKTQYFGLYEVAFDDRLVYTDEKMNYLFSGNIFDLHTMKNLTEAREKQLYAIDFDTLPFDLSELPVVQETGKGNGQSDQRNGLYFRASDTARLRRKSQGHLVFIRQTTSMGGSDVEGHGAQIGTGMRCHSIDQYFDAREKVGDQCNTYLDFRGRGHQTRHIDA